MRWLDDHDHKVALGLFALALIVYTLTMSSTISFWDCGEFVATSHTLGIPHQPGTPLYVLVGRVFSLLPLGLGVAHKINLMSAFFAALAVAFMYLTGVRLQRNWRDEKNDPSPGWLVRCGAAVGSLFLAFSTTFWNSAIEAEVYSLASFVLAFTAYLSVLWYEIRDRSSSATLMLLIIYLMGMSVGFHMGSILVFPGVFVLVMLADRKALRRIDMLIVAAAMGAFVLSTMRVDPSRLEPSEGSIMVLLTSDFFVLALLIGALIAAVWRSVTWGSEDEIPHNRWFALAGILLFFGGLTVHFVMMIRAGHDPLINQSDPTTFDRLLSVLRREQYPTRDMFQREAPIAWQFAHFWGTAIWQEGQLQGRQVLGYVQQFSFLPGASFVDRFVPLALWLFGLFYQLRGNWRLFASFATILFINSVGLILLLNFTSSEVRDRDYFYAGAFQFLALFIGLGAGGLLRSVWALAKDEGWARAFLRPATGLLLVIPLLPVLLAWMPHPKWYEHDRSGNYIARNYGRNILASLPPNAILCTNGDNDTFPLWYLQEVEGFRTDVRVVNLSLINLPWYIKQLRDYEPTVPIRWNDAQIEGEEDIVFRQWRCKLEPERMPDGTPAWVRDKTMWHIVRENKWERPIYWAVTVPFENVGMFVPYLRMEGLVYRLTPDRSEDEMPVSDPQKIWENFSTVYDFTSVLDAEGKADLSIYRDPQTQHLLRNYPAALSRVGYYEAVEGNTEKAMVALEMAYGLEPTFPLIGDILPIVYLQSGETDKALEVGRTFLAAEPSPVKSAIDIGEALITLGETQRAIDWGEELVAVDPMTVEYVQLLVRSLILAGEDVRAGRVIDEWVARSGDTQAREEFELFLQERDKMQQDSLEVDEVPEFETESDGTGGER